MSTTRLPLASTASLLLLLTPFATACGSDSDAGGDEALPDRAEAGQIAEAEGEGEAPSTAPSDMDAASADRPLLSETIREVLEDEGPEAATRRFEAIYTERREDFKVDMEAMGELGGEYMAAGDFERGGAVMAMVAELAQAELVAAMPEGMAEAARAEQERRAREDAAERDAREERAEATVRSREPLPEEVVRRFSGVYGDPDEADATRRFFLAPDPCGGAMMFGAMWGDAANTFMRVESERVLAQPSEWTGPGQGEPLRIEVTLGADGRAERLTHNSEWFVSPLVRTGELPEEWRDSPCTRG